MRITDWNTDGKKPLGEVMENITGKASSDLDMKMILIGNGFSIDFPQDSVLESGFATHLAISPDGTRLAFSTTRAGQTEILVRRIDELQAKLSNVNGRAHKLAESGKSPAEIVTELYLATLSRQASAEELQVATAAFNAPDATRQSATEDVFWALLNSAEFVLNH